MKRISSILTILFITVSIFYQGSKVYGYAFEGLYIAPKIVYSPENPSGRIWNHYAGGGVSLGYDLFRLKDPYPIPVRVELEYIGRLLAANTRVAIHSVTAGIYYDLNLFHVRASELDTLTTRSVYTTKRPFMAIYVGLNIGARIGYITDEPTSAGNTNIGLMQIRTGTSTTTLYFGVGLGFAWHVTSWFTLDLGYRFVLGQQQMFGYKSAHDVLLSFRFTKP